jgi:small subunit ribosomal protein S6
MRKSKYELMLVYVSDLDETGVRAELAKIEDTLTQHQGSTIRTDVWGRRQLSYPVRRRDYGVYVVVVFEAARSIVTELKRQLKINDAVLRYMIVKKDRFAPDFTRRREDEPRGDDVPSGLPYEGGREDSAGI